MNRRYWRLEDVKEIVDAIDNAYYDEGYKKLDELFKDESVLEKCFGWKTKWAKVEKYNTLGKIGLVVKVRTETQEAKVLLGRHIIIGDAHHYDVVSFENELF